MQEHEQNRPSPFSTMTKEKAVPTSITVNIFLNPQLISANNQNVIMMNHSHTTKRSSSARSAHCCLCAVHVQIVDTLDFTVSLLPGTLSCFRFCCFFLYHVRVTRVRCVVRKSQLRCCLFGNTTVWVGIHDTRRLETGTVVDPTVVTKEMLR